MNIIQKTIAKLFNITIQQPTGITGINRGRSQWKHTNLTFPVVVNSDLTKDLYYNRCVITKLGAHFSRNIINIPLGFMGFPHFYPTKKVQKFWQEQFDFYNDKMIKIKQDIQRNSMRDGTVWIFPQFNSTSGRVDWKFLPQANNFYYNIETKELVGVDFVQSIIIDEQGRGVRSVVEKIKYTKTEIITELDGVITRRRNPTGALPVNFINNGEPGEPEGNSDLEVVFPLIQLYSQISKKGHEVLLNHDPKLIQSVTELSKWLKQNGMETAADLANFDIQGVDLIINQKDADETEFIIPSEIVTAYHAALKNIFQNMVEGSEIPEIAWGLKTTGNHASADEQIAVFISYINMKRNFFKSPYAILIDITFWLLSEAFFKRINFGIDQSWSDLELLSKVEKSAVFNNYASGIEKLKKTNSIGDSGVHKLLRGVMGDDFIEEFDEYVKDIEQSKEKAPPDDGANED